MYRTMETVPHDKLPLEIKVWTLYGCFHSSINSLCEKGNVVSSTVILIEIEVILMLWMEYKLFASLCTDH